MNRNVICIALAGLLVPAGVISAATVPYQSDLGESYNICSDWTQQKTSEKYWSYDSESDYSTPRDIRGRGALLGDREARCHAYFPGHYT